jgi:hypothetical protein
MRQFQRGSSLATSRTAAEGGCRPPLQRTWQRWSGGAVPEAGVLLVQGHMQLP